jgi:hypothetical protein
VEEYNTMHTNQQPDLIVIPMAEHSAASLSLSIAWMPLEGVAQQWASFAGAFLTYPAFTATAAVFSALALEAEALQQYDHASVRHVTGEVRLWRAAADEQALHALQDASSQWLCALSWLERLANDTHHPLADKEHSTLRSFFAEATTHLQRLGVLTQQVQAACVLNYQRCGILSQEQEEAR